MRLVLDRTFLELYIDMSSVMFMNGSVITSTVFRLRSQINVTDYNMSLISNLFGVFLDSGFFVDNSSISRTRTLLSLFVRSFGVASTAVLTPFLANANVNSRFNAQYLPSYRLDIRSRIWAFDWHQNRWPWMTLNGEIAYILRYFTEFGSFRGALHKSSWQSHNYGQFTITVSSSKRLQRDRATPTV